MTEVKVSTQVRSITLELDDATGQTVEKCLLVLADEKLKLMVPGINAAITGLHVILSFTAEGRRALHIGQTLDLVIAIPEA